MIQSVAGMESDIESMRERRDALKREYDRATDDETLRSVGMEINSLNSRITSKREELGGIASESVMSAVKLDAEIKTLHGKVQRLKTLVDSYTDEEDIERAEKEIADRENEIAELDRYMVESLLPGGYDRPEHVVDRVRDIVQTEREKWFGNSDIKEEHLNTIKYGRTYEDERGRVRRVPGVIETSIAEHKRAIENVDGIRRDVIEGELLAKTGKDIRFGEKELDRLARIDDPSRMVSDINDACTTKQNAAFKRALGNVDEDGNMLERADIVCNVDEHDIYEAFHHKFQLEKGIPGSGDEYMKTFLETLFEDTFSDGVYEDMSEYNDGEMLIRRINNELLESGVYDSDAISYAIDKIDAEALTSRIDAEAQLDDVFGDHFTKHEYDGVAKDIKNRVSVIDNNREGLLMQFGSLGDSRQILAGKIIEGISKEDFKERWNEEVQKMLEHGESEHGESADVDRKIKKRQVEYAKKMFKELVNNISNDDLLDKHEMENIFVSEGLQPGVVRRLMAGVTDVEYVRDNNAKMLERNMKDLIKRHKMYRDDMFSEGRIYSAVEARAKKEMGDRDGARRYMKDAISKSVSNISMNEYGDELVGMVTKKIGDVVNEASTMTEEECKAERGIAEEFATRKRAFISSVRDEINRVKETATGIVYAGEDEEVDVDIPKRVKSEKELEEEKRAEIEEKLKEKLKTRVPKKLSPLRSAEEMEEFEEVAPKKPSSTETTKERAEMNWWRDYMEKYEKRQKKAKPFREKGLVLRYYKGAPTKYVVYGAFEENIGFSDAKALDKWFKTHYKY